MNTIKIFLASSAELQQDRRKFEEFIGRENKIFQVKGIFLHLEIWEDFIDAISQTRLQDEYNKKIEDADIFVMLFFTKVGMYTSEEFDRALERFKKAGKPLMYTYFKNTPIKPNDLNRKEVNSVFDFQDKLKSLGHFLTVYENDAELKLHFKEQLDKLFTGGHFIFMVEEKSSETTAQQLPKCLSAGEPSIPPGFIGRDIELADIKSKLDMYGLLLVNAEGGMGKTTLAAKYLKENMESYQHYAWLFCESGIIEQIKTLAIPLKIDLTKYPSEDQQLLALKTAMQNLPRQCLLILDNANEIEHIDPFQKIFGGLNWHVLLTSRGREVLPKENEYTLQHLQPGQAKALFKTHHDENTAEFESFLDNFLKAIGYNTLLTELFSKNLHELSAIGETLSYAMEQFREKGLFLGNRSFEITTSYTGNTHKKAVTTDDILEVLYDLTTLKETERYILVNLALMPAESHLLTLLIDILTPGDPINFAKQLKLLARKGWLNSDTASYRLSPVVQQIVLSKNTNRLEDDAVTLVTNLNEKLVHSGGSLVNLKNYASAQPFVEIARSVTGKLDEDRFGTALLFSNVSDCFKAVGNFKASLDQLMKSAKIWEKINKENYSVCLERLGSIYQQQGEFTKALEYFKRYNNLSKELVESNPHGESQKKNLAISYVKLGSIYQQQDEFIKALEYFKRYNDLSKELYESNPHSESLKDGLAISYSTLGYIYHQQRELQKALDYFELANKLFERLYASNPHSESLKSGLVGSYTALGDTYQQRAEFKKALYYFKRGFQLSKELCESNPQSVDLYDYLAVSYFNLGGIYVEMKEQEKAKEYFKMAESIWIQLTERVPEMADYKNNLDWVKSQLENL